MKLEDGATEVLFKKGDKVIALYVGKSSGKDKQPLPKYRFVCRRLLSFSTDIPHLALAVWRRDNFTDLRVDGANLEED